MLKLESTSKRTSRLELSNRDLKVVIVFQGGKPVALSVNDPVNERMFLLEDTPPPAGFSSATSATVTEFDVRLQGAIRMICF